MVVQVTLTFEEPTEGTTIVTLLQTGIPEDDQFGNHDVIVTTEQGWRNQIFNRIKGVFGYGI